ncbi:Delta and Notch-like epidermal growth factor-related receptor [Trichinella spiralis]|uniref:Delta and Notch-like epidermal growth factor-related receptor n=1 Tax=Trichinella spiralis TaxID=6334 RepID=A0ABR3KPJ7_TRISP
MQIETDQPNVVDDQPVATATTTTNQPPGETPVVRITLDTSSNIPGSVSNNNNNKNKTVSFAADQSPMSTSSASLVPQYPQQQKLIASHGTGLSSQGTVLSVGGFLIVGITLITSATIVLLSQKQSEFEFVAGVFMAIAFPRICRSHTLVCQPLKTVIEPQITASPSINRLMATAN